MSSTTKPIAQAVIVLGLMVVLAILPALTVGRLAVFGALTVSGNSTRSE